MVKLDRKGVKTGVLCRDWGVSVKRIGQRRFRLYSETAVGFRTTINHFFRGAMDLVMRLHAPVLSISLASTSPLFIICRTFHVEILCSQHIPRC